MTPPLIDCQVRESEKEPTRSRAVNAARARAVQRGDDGHSHHHLQVAAIGVVVFACWRVAVESCCGWWWCVSTGHRLWLVGGGGCEYRVS